MRIRNLWTMLRVHASIPRASVAAIRALTFEKCWDFFLIDKLALRLEPFQIAYLAGTRSCPAEVVYEAEGLLRLLDVGGAFSRDGCASVGGMAPGIRQRRSIGPARHVVRVVDEPP